RKTALNLARALGVQVRALRQVKVLTLDGFDRTQVEALLREGVLHDPVIQAASLGALPQAPFAADWFVEVGFRPGVTDNEGRTARDTAALFLRLPKEGLSVYTAVQYRIRNEPGKELARRDVERLARDLLCNELIQRFAVKSREEWQAEPGFPARAARVTGAASDEVTAVPLAQMDDEALTAFSRENTLALNLEEMRAIRAQYALPELRDERARRGLPADPTDAEMEMLAQTWSEHCKHKIFAARITYENRETGFREEINSLYKSCIQDATAGIRKRLGARDFCRSVFKDNAGVIAFNDAFDACIKVETHNSPSALDPYGGALTGIVGVNRDPMGTGLGAELVCNTNVFCFASPFHEAPLPPRLLHPRRVLEGVREGVEHGGNKSGIPTVNGSLVFDERFLGKPLVFCGTAGLLPRVIHGREGWRKNAEADDHIVMVGGRIGKDGIHGATFSSEELHQESPATAVQIGDPITQRKMYDFILCARDLGLYSAITDNGAGGLSSSVGEMCEDSGGACLDLAKAPLKYDGLRPWEILLSEAQERMTLAVPPERLPRFLELAAEMDVEATVLGVFTASGVFEAFYRDKPVVRLPLDFLHYGMPQYQLHARWDAPVPRPDAGFDLPAAQQGAFLKRMLGRLNICSKEYIIRQYDHEVRGGSVIKPLMGVRRDGPSDAAVLRPQLDSENGLVIAHGICPKFSDYDTYWMMANAVDEAVRNAAAVGGDPDFMAGVDNFCWCDPVESEKTPDGRHKLAQLVRACKALRHFCLAYGVPCVSGKDSMKNDYSGGGRKISIPPTVLFSVMGVMRDVKLAVSGDFKRAGEVVYLLGGTWRELGGSEAASEQGLAGGRVPHVDAQSALQRYRTLHRCMQQRMITACHDLSDGGLGVAVAEMCLSGRQGAKIRLDDVPALEDMSPAELLYAESASRLLVSVRGDMIEDFEEAFTGQICARIGRTTDDAILRIEHRGRELLREDVEDLARAFKATLDW
ncbi:MAG: phosphoribosylformylglycinamidine synthase, partial [Deltaproteobacteria bacterium]|nr:phosphoribosylformylglycinamidine synthase [Deltaproteobacteria bacterium]